MLSIGQLSRKTGVKVPTIRYYEEVGLLREPERTNGNQRRYYKEDLERLSFIKHARDLGFSIDAINQLVELSAHPDENCKNADKIADEQLLAVRERIAKLTKLEAELKRISKGCKHKSIKECYVIGALIDHSLCENEH